MLILRRDKTMNWKIYLLLAVLNGLLFLVIPHYARLTLILIGAGFVICNIILVVDWFTGSNRLVRSLMPLGWGVVSFLIGISCIVIHFLFFVHHEKPICLF